MRFSSVSAIAPTLPPPVNNTSPNAAPFRLWLAERDRRPRAVRFPSDEVRRIIVGIDFSPASDTAMGLVCGIAATTGTVVDLVHVFDGFTEAFVLGNRRALDDADALLARVERGLRARTTAAASEGVRCVATSLVGAPGLEITRHARRTGVDLLVLGIGPETRGPFGRAWSVDAADQALRTGAWQQRPLFASAAF